MLPVVNLEALIFGGGDGKVSCETSQVEDPFVSSSPRKWQDELPESFRLSIKDGIEWIDYNAAPYLERDDSTKEITNPKSTAHQNFSGNLSINLKSNSSSQLLSSKPKAPIIALPNKLRHSGYLGRSRRHAPIFPKKASRKAEVPESEPNSPKVSCMGRVLSDRDRRRRRRTTDGASRPSPICCFFFFRRKNRSLANDDGYLPSSTTTTSARSTRGGGSDDVIPRLGDLKRFVSGRKSGSWSEERD